MIEYFFYFNDLDEFVCKIKTDGFESVLTDERALDELSRLDSFKFDHVRASNRFITLKNEDTYITINNIRDFFDRKYDSYLKNSIEQVNKAITKYQRKKKKDKVVENLKIGGSRVAIGSLIALIISSPIMSHKNAKKDNKLNDYSIEAENEEQAKIKLDNVDISLEDLDDLMDELQAMEKNQGLYDQAVIEELNEEKDINNNTAYLDYYDNTDSITFTGAHEKYYDVVNKYATKWGISPNLIMAMLTQESAGKRVNLMQIQFYSWKDQVITNYDFVNNRYQSIVLTDEPGKYEGRNIMTISREDLDNKITNISVGCVILRYCLERMNYNILASIQAYNLGCSNMYKVLNETSYRTGVSVDDLLKDQTNSEFMSYTDIVGCGDPEYLMNVARYIEDSENGVSIKILDEDNEVQEISIAIESQHRRY